jgi:hypothetical protein
MSTIKIDELIELLNLKSQAEILDIACGKGEILTRLAERCAFLSFSANFRRVRTESENVPICGSGSGSVAINSCRRGTSDLNPRKILPCGPEMYAASLSRFSPSRMILQPSA